ncbi:MAG: GGDEF domain-containing protein, partial [Alphaproteobacteria bacterium]
MRATVLGPRLAAFLPAIMLGAYWFGGEGVLLTAAVVFPALIAAFGLIGQVGGNRTALDPVTGLPGRPQLASALTPAVGDFSGATGADRIALVLEIDRASDLARQHGTAGFEEILRSTGARLEGVLRNNDVVTSLGGGRFGIALAKTPRMTIETMT